MSAQVVIDFFPDLTRLITEEAPGIWKALFPEALQQKCPEMTTQILSLSIRSWPLAVFAWLGAVVGWSGFKSLLRHKGHVFWAFSFFFYAFMNLAALACHCFLPRTTPAWEKFVMLDVAFTGSAATLAALAALRLEPTKKPVAVLFAFLVGLFFLAVSSYGQAYDEPYLNEFVYMVTTLLAVAAVSVTEFRRQDVSDVQNFGLGLAIVGVVIAANGILADQYLCKNFGGPLNHVHFLFLGCSVVYAGLLMHLKSGLADKKQD